MVLRIFVVLGVAPSGSLVEGSSCSYLVERERRGFRSTGADAAGGGCRHTAVGWRFEQIEPIQLRGELPLPVQQVATTVGGSALISDFAQSFVC